MIVLSWNCRGLGNVDDVPCLKNLIRSHKPDVVFLFETLLLADRMERVKWSIGFENCFALDQIGRGVGISVLWTNQVKCEIKKYSIHHIDLEVDEKDVGKWRLTGYYKYPERSRRNESWNLIQRLSGLSNSPWCMIGDYNDLLSPDDKIGGCEHPNYLFRGFQSAMHDAGLVDINLEGYPFTWSFAKGTDRAIEQRLDRAMKSWFDIFPGSNLKNLISSKSDHAPILLKTNTETISRGRRRFLFENAWL